MIYDWVGMGANARRCWARTRGGPSSCLGGRSDKGPSTTPRLREMRSIMRTYPQQPPQTTQRGDQSLVISRGKKHAESPPRLWPPRRRRRGRGGSSCCTPGPRGRRTRGRAPDRARRPCGRGGWGQGAEREISHRGGVWFVLARLQVGVRARATAQARGSRIYVLGAAMQRLPRAAEARHGDRAATQRKKPDGRRLQFWQLAGGAKAGRARAGRRATRSSGASSGGEGSPAEAVARLCASAASREPRRQGGKRSALLNRGFSQGARLSRLQRPGVLERAALEAD